MALEDRDSILLSVAVVVCGYIFTVLFPSSMVQNATRYSTAPSLSRAEYEIASMQQTFQTDWLRIANPMRRRNLKERQPYPKNRCHDGSCTQAPTRI